MVVADAWMSGLKTKEEVKNKRRYMRGNLEKYHRWTYLQSRNRETENKWMETKEGRMGEMDWEVGTDVYTLLLLLSRFSRVRLCATPETAAHQAPLSLGFSRQEHSSGLPFPSPMHESEKWKWNRSVVSDSSGPHGLQPTRLLFHGIFQARTLEWGQGAAREVKKVKVCGQNSAT